MSPIKRLLNSEFTVNVAKLVSGNTVAQILPFLLLPFITRLFSPSDFASFEQFIMLTEILVIPATLKYQFAIMHPKKEEDAILLLYFILLFSFVVCILYTVLGFALAPWTSELLENPNALLFLPFIGFSVFLLSCHEGFNYWFSRKKRYGTLGSTKVIETAVAEGGKIAFWNFGFKNLGLIYGFLGGRVAMTVTYFVRYWRGSRVRISSFNWSRLKELLKEYVNYPKYVMLANLLGTTTSWTHIFLFSIYFEPVVGFIALARRLAFAPLTIISQAYGQVFYQKISEIDNPLEIRRIYDKSLRPLVLFGVVTTVLVLLLPENTFAFVFGDDWGRAQPYIQILIFWFVSNFISSCFSFVFLRLKKQKQILQLDMIHFVIVLAAIYSGIGLGFDGKGTLIIFSVAQTFFYVYMIVLGRRYVKEFAYTSN